MCLLTCLATLSCLPARAPAPAADKQNHPEPKKTPRVDRFGDPLPPGAVARLGTLRFRQRRAASGLVFARDGKTLFSTDGDGVNAWDVRTGKRLRRLAVQGANLRALAFAPGGKLLAVGENAEHACLWDASAGKVLHRLKRANLGGAIRSLLDRLATDGRTVAIAGGHLRFWDAATGKELTWGGTPNPSALALAPGGRTLACNEGLSDPGDRTLALWNRATGRRLHRLHPAPGRLRGSARHASAITALAFAPDGKTLVSATLGRTVRFWNVATGQLVRRLGNLPPADALALSPDGKTLALGNDHGYLGLFHAATGKPVRPPAGHRGAISALAFSPDGATLASGSWDDTVGLWDVAKARLRHRLPGFGGGVLSVAFSPDGRAVAAGTYDLRLRVWDAAGGKELCRPGRMERRGHLLAFSASGPAPDSSKENPPVHFRSLTTGRHKRVVVSGDVGLALSPGREAVAVADGNNGVILWELTSGEQRRFSVAVKTEEEDTDDPVSRLTFSADGRTLFTLTEDGNLRLWEVVTGKIRLSREFRAPDNLLAVSPDGRLLATADRTGGVLLWGTLTGRKLHRFAGHRGPVLALAFSPDGRALASGGWDSTVLLWDVAGSVRRPRPAPLTDDRLGKLWGFLAGDNARKAFRTVEELAAGGDRTIAYLQGHCRPVPRVSKSRIRRLVADLDDRQYRVRSRASRELERLGELAEPLLRRALAGKPSPEVRRRAQALFNKLDRQRLPHGDRLRQLRAVEVLERIPSPRARRVLAALARGGVGARLTLEAKASLRRLNH
jgi:WD40 repeat protein